MIVFQCVYFFLELVICKSIKLHWHIKSTCLALLSWNVSFLCFLWTSLNLMILQDSKIFFFFNLVQLTYCYAKIDECFTIFNQITIISMINAFKLMNEHTICSLMEHSIHDHFLIQFFLSFSSLYYNVSWINIYKVESCIPLLAWNAKYRWCSKEVK